MNFEKWLRGAANSFPSLNDKNCLPTSPIDERYNCIAWAAGESDRWWWPDGLGISYWPKDAPRTCTMPAFEAAYGLHGYRVTSDASVEPGVEKVAIYAADNGIPTHAARQLTDGWWTSKLGVDIDIAHELSALEGPFYGRVALILARPTS